MKRSKGKILVTTLMLVTAGIMMLPNQAKAALQSNGGSPAQKGAHEFITEIRKMQTAGGGLGLTDTIDETNLTSQNKNLDIHMQKNTEYGAIAILSASAYGNPNKIEDGGTTTGNNTGIVMHLNKEWAIAVPSNMEATSIRNAAGRYKNVYTAPNYTAKVGDAIDGMQGWHGSTASTWLSAQGNVADRVAKACIVRSYSGSIFSYYGYAFNVGMYGDSLEPGHYSRKWSGRAIVVVGSGV